MGWFVKGGFVLALCASLVGVFADAAVQASDSAPGPVAQSVEDEPWGGDDQGLVDGGWSGAYWPNALPADTNPYDSLFSKYAEQGRDEKLEEARDKGAQYQACTQVSQGGAEAALAANRTYRHALDMGDSVRADMTTKEETAKVMKISVGSFLSRTFDKVYELAYAMPGNPPTQAAIDEITRKTLCECLSYPTDEFIEEENL